MKLTIKSIGRQSQLQSLINLDHHYWWSYDSHDQFFSAYILKFATYGTRASVFKAKAVLRPGGRHPRSPWTLGDAAGVTSESAEAEVPPHGESATATDDNTTTNVDGDDDDADNTDMDYSKIYISEDLTRQRQFIFWKTRQAKKTHRIKDCWTTDGQIIIRNNANKIIPINSLNDLINNT